MTLDLSSLASHLSAVPVVLAVFLSGFLEGLAIPFPGTWLLALIGGAARLTVSELFGLSLITAAGYTTSSLVPYALGVVIRQLGSPAFLPRLGLTDDRLDHLQAWFARYGEPAVAWSRPLWIGNLVSIPAGIVRMPLWRFTLFTLVGIWPWALSILWIGDEAGALMENFGTWAFWLMSAGIALAVAAGWYRQMRLRRRQAEEAAD
ncbi:MAG: VTT domain-containing protein [Firmicutes bacterium]|nr:VTT domain-containing protein [Bacillota bacterium]